MAGIDLLIPLLDIGYALIWLPGLVLFLFGVPLIVSLWTLFVLPITLVVYGGLRGYQSRRVFAPLGLRVRKNRFGYVAFLLSYQALCSMRRSRGTPRSSSTPTAAGSSPPTLSPRSCIVATGSSLLGKILTSHLPVRRPGRSAARTTWLPGVATRPPCSSALSRSSWGPCVKSPGCRATSTWRLGSRRNCRWEGELFDWRDA